MTSQKSKNLHDDASTAFGLFRHGQTVWNEEGRIQGSKDSPLSRNGINKLKEAATILQQRNWTRIIASDLGRAQQTVYHLNCKLRLPVDYDRGLREINWGEWEGIRRDELKQKFGSILNRQVQAGWDFTAPGGESRKAALNRAKSVLLRAAKKYPGEKILIICHQGIIKCLLYDIHMNSFLPGENVEVEKNALHLIRVDGSSMLSEQLNIQCSQMG